MPNIYAIANQKGGVGKSTSCACLASGLAEQGHRVLMVDMDPQAGLTTSFGFNPEDFEATIYNILINSSDDTLDKVIVSTKIDNVHLAPANLDLAGAEAELIGEIGWDRTLKEVLASVKGKFDYILIDCPPSLGVLTTNALIAAELVIVPVQAEYLAMRGLKHLNSIIQKVRKKANPRLKTKILRTMHSKRTLHSQEVVQEIEKVFGDQAYRTIIKRTVKFADSTLAGEPILSYAEGSEAAMAYRELTNEVLQDEQKKTISQG